MEIINCNESGNTITSYIEEYKPKRILLLFFHGLGDFLGFRGVYKYLIEEYPDIEFAYGLDKNMGYERFLLEYEKYELIDRASINMDNYDFGFLIAYTQNREKYTLVCLLGIPYF